MEYTEWVQVPMVRFIEPVETTSSRSLLPFHHNIDFLAFKHEIFSLHEKMAFIITSEKEFCNFGGCCTSYSVVSHQQQVIFAHQVKLILCCG